jgi:hypothetical protein
VKRQICFVSCLTWGRLPSAFSANGASSLWTAPAKRSGDSAFRAGVIPRAHRARSDSRFPRKLNQGKRCGAALPTALQNAAYIRRARMREGTHFCASLAIASPVEDTPWRARTASPARTKNVHRVGRVSGGLLNPSGGARTRPRNKSVLAQLENELNHNFASGTEIRLNHFQKVSPA